MSQLRRFSAVAAAAMGATAIALAPAAVANAAPQIHCTGAMCVNRGDTPGIGHGTYTCPNGLQYPSIAFVPAHSTAWVFPANCGQPRLY
ncbi:hypothetical protein GOARA_008_00070 [Gordonia araii NBRC 100433]|uniref:Secreted protein n=1 Tax=Gordonia araii NBRC 100433 TaxID=1073574 RepID=G7GXI2_9ACTN|nr:hypothetical protein [Gordonia araii]NNG98252.1 hypothetical protein [Gordonia araii NBRC 100433]GAB08307.1 hypothetical protein GOARA_008_00070 [Gordonia araii NBRC 100433]